MRGSGHAGSPLIVACTGWGQKEDRARSEAAGFDAHLVKPVEPRAVLELLSSLPPHRVFQHA